MRDQSYQLAPGAAEAPAPFAHHYVARRRNALWHIRDADGRRIGQANTRAGARAAVRALWAGRVAA